MNAVSGNSHAAIFLLCLLLSYRQSIHYEHADADSAGNQRVHTQEDRAFQAPQRNNASTSFRPFLGSLSQPGKKIFLQYC